MFGAWHKKQIYPVNKGSDVECQLIDTLNCYYLLVDYINGHLNCLSLAFNKMSFTIRYWNTREIIIKTELDITVYDLNRKIHN